MKKLKHLPRFSSEAAEQAFWQTHDSTDYLDWSNAKQAVFPDLKLSTQTISLRLSESLLNRVKIAAHKRDIPYQTFIKVLVDQGLQREMRQE